MNLNFLRSLGDSMDSQDQELLDYHFLSPIITISRPIIHGRLLQKLLGLQTTARIQFIPNLFPIWPALSLHGLTYMCQTEWVIIWLQKSITTYKLPQRHSIFWKIILEKLSSEKNPAGSRGCLNNQVHRGLSNVSNPVLSISWSFGYP